MMITGPFGLRWGERLCPRMEIGEISANDPPTSYRTCRWLELAPMIGTDLFIKLHTHGTQERNSTCLLGSGLQSLFTCLSAECSKRNCSLHYVTAWEMFLAVNAIRELSDPVKALMSDRSRPTNPDAIVGAQSMRESVPRSELNKEWSARRRIL